MPKKFSYTSEGFLTTINQELAAGRTNAHSQVARISVTSISPTSPTQLNVVMSDSSVTASFPHDRASIHSQPNPCSAELVKPKTEKCGSIHLWGPRPLTRPPRG